VFLNQPELIYAVFVAFFVANIALVPLGFLAIRSARQLLRIPRRVLMPIILIFCVVGAFAINNTIFGVTVMLVLGVLAYVMEENGFPIAPTILGIVLGPMLEDNFMSSMIKADGDLLGFFSADGDLLGFFSRPIALVLGIVTLSVWFLPPLLRAMRVLRARMA
jgi:TctA family transporter